MLVLVDGLAVLVVEDAFEREVIGGAIEDGVVANDEDLEGFGAAVDEHVVVEHDRLIVLEFEFDVVAAIDQVKLE